MANYVISQATPFSTQFHFAQGSSGSMWKMVWLARLMASSANASVEAIVEWIQMLSMLDPVQMTDRCAVTVNSGRLFTILSLKSVRLHICDSCLDYALSKHHYHDYCCS